MPELPEVETVARCLDRQITGKQIVCLKVDKSYTRVLATHTPSQLERHLAHKTITGVSRRAKFVIINLTTGLLAVHLRMTGRLYTNVPEDTPLAHIRLSIRFSDGSHLYFQDVRKFGRVYYYDNLSPIDCRHGIEPLSSSFTSELLYELLRSKKRMMKPLLLDQRIIAGIGNIYADEALWAAKIHPMSTSVQVSQKKTIALHTAIQHILTESIKRNGTTFQSFYFGGDNTQGEFREQLNVFGRQGNPCPRCKTKIIKTVVAQRGTHLCPRCQRCQRQ